MIVNFISVLAIATNSSHHRASLRTRAHGSRFFARSRGATCATLTRTPLRRSLSAMVGMSFSATPTHQTNLSTQKPSLGIFTAHKDRRRCSQWVEGSIPSALTILSTTWRPRPIPRPCLFRVSAVFTANRFLVARYISVPNP